MAQETKNTGESLHKEISELEKMLEERRKALAERGEEKEHKEVFREVFKEKYAPAPPAKAPPLPPPPGAELREKEEELKKKAREEQVDFLVQVSFEKGVADAVKMARRATPWLLDELHDRLIDEYYQKLVQAKQIQ